MRPEIFDVACERPRLKPFQRKKMPMITPVASPAIPASAFQSPPASRRYARQGQPRKMSAPIIAKTPRKKRTIGDEPLRGEYSPKASADRNAPMTNPPISGRRYWTTAARCSPSAPAMSRVKHATHIPMLPGLPNFTRSAASAPMTAPAIIGP